MVKVIVPSGVVDDDALVPEQDTVKSTILLTLQSDMIEGLNGLVPVALKVFVVVGVFDGVVLGLLVLEGVILGVGVIVGDVVGVGVGVGQAIAVTSPPPL